jgi:hypothetical protein
MLRHLATRFVRTDAVAGFDIMNEPGVSGPQMEAFDDFSSDALQAIREAEQATGAPSRMVLLEPATPRPPGEGPPLVQQGQNVAYAPHPYAGGLSGKPFDSDILDHTITEAKDLFGAPVIAGEWGAGPSRVRAGYFAEHLDRQDKHLMSSMLWQYRVSCGDPHAVARSRAGGGGSVWGLFEMDCATNAASGMRADLLDELTRPYVRAAPGKLGEQRYEEAAERFTATGQAPRTNRATLLVFWPAAKHGAPQIRARGMGPVRITRMRGGVMLVRAVPRGRWSLTLRARR